MEAVHILKMLKAAPLVDGRRSKDVRMKMGFQRRIIKNSWTRTYRIKIFFKQYKHSSSFEMEYQPPVIPIHDKNKAKYRLNSEPIKFAKLLQDHAEQELGRFRKEVLRNVTDTKIVLKEHPVEIMGSRYNKPYVYSKPGQIYTISLKRKVKNLYVAKLPEKSYRYIGLELEFCAPIAELDFAVKLWKAGVDKFAQMKKDGSLRPKMGEYGYELAILLPESNYKQSVRKLCKILEEVGARADDRRCGLHVHIDMRKRRKKDVVYNNFVACQNVLFSFLDPSRRDNEFCRTVASRSFPTKFTNEREERYKTINAASYYKYKTLEIRMHEGSVNYQQIINWMGLLVKISNRKTRVKSDINELTTLKKRFRIDDKMREFFQDKMCFWQLQGPQRRSGAFRTASEMLRTETVSNILDAEVDNRETE